MNERKNIELSNARFSIRVSEFTPPEHLEFVPDAARFVLEIKESDGSVREHQIGYICLEHAFLLRNRLETRESGLILWGTGGTDIRFDGEMVTLFGSPGVVGTVEQARTATEDLLDQMFTYLHQHDIETREMAQNITESRFAPWDIDPVAIHDRLINQ